MGKCRPRPSMPGKFDKKIWRIWKSWKEVEELLDCACPCSPDSSKKKPPRKPPKKR